MENLSQVMFDFHEGILHPQNFYYFNTSKLKVQFYLSVTTQLISDIFLFDLLGLMVSLKWNFFKMHNITTDWVLPFK